VKKRFIRLYGHRCRTLCWSGSSTKSPCLLTCRNKSVQNSPWRLTRVITAPFRSSVRAICDWNRASLLQRLTSWHCVSLARQRIRWCIQKFLDWVDNEIYAYNSEHSLRRNTVMAAKLTRLAHKIAIQLHLVAESCTICSSRSRRPVRELLIHPRTLKACHVQY
jgi:hypothetical protein